MAEEQKRRRREAEGSSSVVAVDETASKGSGNDCMELCEKFI
jgi:hypothetical protein